ncbi:hypothetical protein ACJX0J_023624 [Zea mays]
MEDKNFFESAEVAGKGTWGDSFFVHNVIAVNSSNIILRIKKPRYHVCNYISELLKSVATECLQLQQLLQQHFHNFYKTIWKHLEITNSDTYDTFNCQVASLGKPKHIILYHKNRAT